MAVLFSILGLLGVPVSVYLLSLCIRGGVSLYGWAWMAAFIVLDLAALWAQSYPRRARIGAAIGAALIAGILGVRNAKSHPTQFGTTLVLPGGGAGPWIDRLADDADLGMMLFVAMTDFGGIRGEDARRAKPYVRSAWRRMRRDPDFAPVPSPIPSELLNASSPASAHVLVLNPQERAARAVIFLHGTGGASKLPCYLLARRMPDAMILCPSVGLGGEWANERGEAIWTQTFNYARAHAAGVYVIGFGYGGRGMQHLLSHNFLGHLAGAVLLSGFEETYFEALRRSSIPLLIMRGDEDARTPPFRVEGVAGLERVRNVELPGGYFVLYESEDAVLEEIDSFCGAR